MTGISRETWRAEGFEGVESTTIIICMKLKEGASLHVMPHQLPIFGGNAYSSYLGAPRCSCDANEQDICAASDVCRSAQSAIDLDMSPQTTQKLT